MSDWNKTSCVLCAQNCGLEIRVENNRMVKVRPDKDNPRSEGYACRKGLNVAFHYSPLAQELTGIFWGWCRATGRQYLFGAPDHEQTEVLVAMGWNGMQSHQMPQARRFLTRMAKDPDKVLVVIDPRRLVIIPHGFGLVYEGQEQGVNVNRLTRNTHRDPLAGTPLHRYVPCRVEAV
jgi:anaerobic selenocysteine-containing dehydrogenase